MICTATNRATLRRLRPLAAFSRSGPHLVHKRVAIGELMDAMPGLRLQTPTPATQCPAAYVLEAGAFQDLTLTRLRGVELTSEERPAGAEAEADTAWQTQVPLRIVPHPALNTEQKQMVRAEYFGGSAARTELLRAALLPYVIQDLHVALDPTAQVPPEFQLCVDGVSKLAEWLMPSAFSA